MTEPNRTELVAFLRMEAADARKHARLAPFSNRERAGRRAELFEQAATLVANDPTTTPGLRAPMDEIVVGGDGFASHGDCDPEDAVADLSGPGDENCWICGEPLPDEGDMHE